MGGNKIEDSKGRAIVFYPCLATNAMPCHAMPCHLPQKTHPNLVVPQLPEGRWSSWVRKTKDVCGTFRFVGVSKRKGGACVSPPQHTHLHFFFPLLPLSLPYSFLKHQQVLKEKNAQWAVWGVERAVFHFVVVILFPPFFFCFVFSQKLFL